MPRRSLAVAPRATSARRASGAKVGGKGREVYVKKRKGVERVGAYQVGALTATEDCSIQPKEGRWTRVQETVGEAQCTGAAIACFSRRKPRSGVSEWVFQALIREIGPLLVTTQRRITMLAGVLRCCAFVVPRPLPPASHASVCVRFALSQCVFLMLRINGAEHALHLTATAKSMETPKSDIQIFKSANLLRD